MSNFFREERMMPCCFSTLCYRRVFSFLLVFIAAIVWSCPNAVGDDISWIGGDGGDWFNIYNWSPNQLPGFDHAIIDGGYASIVDGEAGDSALLLDIGFDGSGGLNQTGGILHTSQIRLGYLIGSSGTYTLSGGTLDAGTIWIGTNGETEGVFNFVGGTLLASGIIIQGYRKLNVFPVSTWSRKSAFQPAMRRFMT
ncbi:MAG: hypothetical protein JXB10_18870, partial [Pirellulales bacterium]|nr:hypothetical protein [Pirellulales bacterium]